jgi:ferredoxin
VTWWFLRGLRTGVVTTRYPEQAEPSAATLPSPPLLRADRLTGATVDAMAAVCPSRALWREGDWLRYDVGACTACGRCMQVSGDAARPSGRVELAATSREDLVKSYPIVRREDR